MTNTSSSIRRGYAYVSIAAILWAVSGSASKYLFNNGLSPFQIVQMRTTIAFVGLLIWLGFRHPSLLRIAPRDTIYFLLLGIFGIAAAQFFYLFAISKINVAAAILLQYTGPVFVTLYSIVFTRYKLRPATVIAIIGTLTGCFLVVGAYNIDLIRVDRAGIIGGLLAAVAFATYSLLSEYGMRKYNPWTVLFYAMFFAALIWNILHFPLAAFFHGYSPVAWGWILFIGVLGTIVSFGFYFEGINLMIQNNILAILKVNKHYIKNNYSVTSIGLFGSYARNDFHAGSDIDVLVTFSEPTFDHYMDLKFYLEDLFGRPVDLVLEGNVKKRLKKIITQGTVYV